MTLPALLSLLALSPAQIEVRANVGSGDIVSGVRTFRVSAVAPDPITQVEFYVGDELRDSDTSVPYEFKLDTIDENDGELQLTFAAYTTKGDSEKRRIYVRVDNGISKGADFHANQGIELLQDSKWDDAILAARIALKATPGFNPARKVMARAYLGKGQLDKAQKFAEDWLASEPDNLEAAELLAGINVNRALNTVSRGTDRNETIKAISEAFKASIENRHRSMATRLEGPMPTGDAAIPYADAAIRAQRYSLAISALTPVYKANVSRKDLSNRLAYAQLRAGRISDAIDTLSTVEKIDGLDDYGLSLMAVICTLRGHAQLADKYMREAILADASSLAVKTAQTYLALVGGKAAVYRRLEADLDGESGGRPEVAYYLFALANAQGEPEVGRKYFERAIVAEPLLEEAYLEEGNRSLAFAIASTGSAEEKAFRHESARAMFETALLVRPESHRALQGMAYAMLEGKKIPEAVRYAEAAAKAAPDQAAPQFTLAAIYRAANRMPEAAAANQRAWRLDEPRLRGRMIPDAVQAMRYAVTYDRVPVLALPR